MSLLPFFASPPQKPVSILFHWFDYNKRNYLPFLLLMIILPATSPTLNRGKPGIEWKRWAWYQPGVLPICFVRGGLLISSAVTSAPREAQRCRSPPLSFPTASIYHLLNGGHLWHTDQIGCIYQRGKNTFVDSIYLTRAHSASIMRRIEVLWELSRNGDLD